MRSIYRCLALLIIGSTLLVPREARAQDDVTLRLAYRGDFLPERTAVVVLARGATTERGSIQPEFLTRDAYPMTSEHLLRRDTLGRDQRTAHRYPKTQASRQRYFVYARTPDETVYWSYSAERDRLKYDIVATGVMSVAPVEDSTTAASIVQRFFADPEVQPMTAASVVDSIDTSEDTTEVASEAEVSSAAPPAMPGTESDPPAAPPATTVPQTTSGITLPYWLFFSLLGLVAAGIAVPVRLWLRCRDRLLTRQKHMQLLRSRLVSANVNVDRYAETRRTLAEVQEKYEKVLQAYNDLVTRHQEVTRQLERAKHRANGE